MKKHLLKSLLAVALLLVCGNVWGVSVTYTFTPNNNTTGNNSGSYVTSESSFTHNGIGWTFRHWNPSSLQVKTNQSSADAEFYFKNTSAFSGKITQVVIKFAALTVTDASKLCFVGGTSEISSLENGTAGTWNAETQTLTWTPASTSAFTYFAFYQGGKAASGTNKLATTDAIAVTYEAEGEGGDTPATVATPTFTPNGGNFIESQQVSIACATEGASISYTTDDWATSNTYSEPFTLTETTTVKAIATKDGMTGSSEVSATFTKIVPMTTMDAIFEASETNGNYLVSLNNWVVSGVKGSNAYITDGTKGFIVYKSEHGFEVGDVLSGTVELALKRYNGAAETTNLTTTTQGLTVTKGGSLTPQTASIANLGGVNTGAVIVLENVTYNGSEFSNGTNTIKPYNTFMDLPAFVNGRKYNVTGVYVQYKDTKEIAPRTAADIEEVAATQYAISVVDSENGNIETDVTEAAEGTVVTLTINPADHYQLSTLTVTDANEIDIDVSGDYTFTMPACDVTISATFTEKAKHTVTYMSLGAQVGEAENVYDGELCANMPDVTNIPEDWTFAGWTTQSSYAMSTTAPAMFSATTPVTADVTLYAVFARTTEGGAASGWYKVTENLSDWSGEYLLVYEYEGDESHGAVAWTGVDAGHCHVDATIKNSVISEAPSGAVTLTIAPMDGGYSIKINGGDKDGQYIGRKSYSNGMDFNDEEQLNTIAIQDGSAEIKGLGTDNTGKQVVLRYNSSTGDTNERFRYYKSGQQPVQLYKNSGNTASYIYTTTAPQAQDITISSVGWATACVPFTATVSGATAYTAKVEDGALVMTPITVIPAGTGVLLESVNGGATTATFTESGLEGDDVNGNQLCGNATNASVTWGNEEGATAIFTYYIFANDAEDGLGFYWQKGTGGNSVSCGAYKAALVVPGTPATESGAIGYRIGGTTMVEQMLNDSKSAEIYDLLGRKVENATKGLYIIGGKKVMVK